MDEARLVITITHRIDRGEYDPTEFPHLDSTSQDGEYMLVHEVLTLPVDTRVQIDVVHEESV